MYEAWAQYGGLLITGHASAQTNYPVRVNVTWSAEMQSNFDDLRFTNAAGDTALVFWRARYVSGVSAVFYVVVPSLPASGSSVSIRRYSGNAAASYAGAARGANGIFLSYDGASNSALPHATGAHVISKGSSGAWDDSYIASDGGFVKNLDGSLYVDGDGYSWATYNGANQARRATIDTSSPYDGDNAPGDDCPGFFKFLASDPENTVTKVSTTDPFLKWGSGTWAPNSGTIWDGRVVQQGHIFYDGAGVLTTAGTFICFYDGDAGPANVAEAYRQGIATATSLTGTWTKKSTGNPSGQAWTFAHSYLNSGSNDDMIAYAGGFVYDPDDTDSNKRWKQWYTGHTGSKWGIMYATSPTYYGPWTRYQPTYVWQPRPSDGGWNGWVDWAMKVRGVYYVGFIVLGSDTDSDGRRKHAFYVGRSEDGVNWTLDGEYFKRSTTSGDWDYGRIQGADVVYNHVTGKWMQHYTASDIGNGAYGDTPAYVPPLKIAVTQWTGTPAFLSTEPTVTASGGVLTIDPTSTTWTQVGAAITVGAASGSRTSVSAVASSGSGGLVRFAGTHASRFSVSLDNVTFTASVTIPAGTTTIYLGVTPQAGDGALTARVGVAV